MLSAVNFPRKCKQELEKESLSSYPLITINISDSEKQHDEPVVYKPRITVSQISKSTESCLHCTKHCI